MHKLSSMATVHSGNVHEAKLKQENDENSKAKMKTRRRRSSKKLGNITQTTTSDECSNSKMMSKASDNSQLSTSSQVSFDETVSICSIPRRCDYSRKDRVKMHDTYCDRDLQILRNSIEYAYECYDWRHAIVEDEMEVCNYTGERIHPAHTNTSTRDYLEAKKKSKKMYKIDQGCKSR